MNKETPPRAYTPVVVMRHGAQDWNDFESGKLFFFFCTFKLFLGHFFSLSKTPNYANNRKCVKNDHWHHS